MKNLHLFFAVCLLSLASLANAQQKITYASIRSFIPCIKHGDCPHSTPDTSYKSPRKAIDVDLGNRNYKLVWSGTLDAESTYVSIWRRVIDSSGNVVYADEVTDHQLKDRVYAGQVTRGGGTATLRQIIHKFYRSQDHTLGSANLEDEGLWNSRYDTIKVDIATALFMHGR